MVKHIVMWKLNDSAHGATKRENALKIKQMLESLKDKIPGIIKIEVGIDFSKTDSSADIVLYSEFSNRDALNAYQEHPEHKAVIPFVTEARSERRVVDYDA